ncbi:vacuolar sorting protein 3 isoform X2 [Aristolochia californica]|uniref:vacuolar sorting protein 3 isoform X2 n=1 Tax=Aristolochia californica TaxID=171875 RepID=UPI0035DD94AD
MIRVPPNFFMAKLEPKDRKVLYLFAGLDASNAKIFPRSYPRSFQSITVSTISTSQTLIYIGTEDGKVVLLSLNPSLNSKDNSSDQDPASSRNIDFLRSVSVSDSPVIAIYVFVEIGRILVLSDGTLYLLDTLLLQPARKLSFPKGVSVVAKRSCCEESNSVSLDRFGDGVPRAEISAGQRLFLKLGGIRGGMKSRASEHRGDRNCVIAIAASKKLIFVELLLPGNDADTSSVFIVLNEIQGVDGVRSMVWIDDSIIVGTDDGYSMISCSSGQITLLFSLPESSNNPYLKSMWKQEGAILLVDNVGIVVNSLGQPVGGSLVFRNLPDSIGDIGFYVIVVRDGSLDLYHKKTGARIQSISFAAQGTGRCIIADLENGNSEVVVVASPSKVLCFRKASAEEQIKDLLKKKNFKEVISLVEELESMGELTKEMLSFVHAQVGFLLLFDLHFEDAVNHFLLSETMEPSEVFPFIMRDPNRWSQLVPRNRYWGLHPPPVPLEDVVDDGLMAIQRAVFLRKAGVETTVDEKHLLNPPNRSDLLESAIHNMIRYLRVSRDKDLNPSVREGVDTLLMYLYRALNCVDEMEQLASSPNSCLVEELETLLHDSGHLRTLAFLYANKGRSTKALDIWRILARNYSSGIWKDPKGSEDNSVIILSAQEIAVREASKLLEESSDVEMVLQHLGWIADVDEDLALRVLTSSKRSHQLPPEEVLAAIDPKKVEIQQRFLQWLIDDQESDDCQFHTMYAVSLAKSALEAVEMELTSQNPSSGIMEEVNEKISRIPVRAQLQLFLFCSDLYDPEEVLYLIEGSELWLEKAILYRKLGQETLVLQILALKLEDSEAAEQYCAEIGRPDAYMQLLDMYLDPQDGKEPMFTAAVRLLHKHGESLDPLQVLEI